MRFAYLFSAVVIGFGAWSELINQRRLIDGGKPWDLIYGIAFSLYAAYAPLMLLGVRFPVRMLPLLLLQISYKLIWLIAVGYTLWSSGRLNPEAIGTMRFFAAIVVLDLVVIPWRYVYEKYTKPIFNIEDKQTSLSKEQTGPA